MFWTGFALYLFIVAEASEVAPTIISPSINFEFATTNKHCLPPTSSINIVVVAPEVWPVITSPFWKSPNVVSSNNTLSPSSSPSGVVPFKLR